VKIALGMSGIPRNYVIQSSAPTVTLIILQSLMDHAVYKQPELRKSKR
jgi:hypothetical protein